MQSEDYAISKKPQRQRKRVPIACLHCKKRKVKCDKVKPACGGCVRNGVAELCQYLEPAWASNTNATPVKEDIPIISEEVAEDFTKIRLQQEQLIEYQKREIENLRRQLSAVQQPSHSIKKREKDEDTRHISILKKLNPLSVNANKQLDIKNDVQHTIVYCKSNNNEYVDIYSWINIIKLDPYLTRLWFKITNLQKAYHLYKKNLTKLKEEGGIGYRGDETINMGKKNDYKINEIDFTYSVGSSNSPYNITKKNKCPVIECDFNFMVDYKSKSSGSTPSVSTSTPMGPSSTPMGVLATPSVTQATPLVQSTPSDSQLSPSGQQITIKQECPYRSIHQEEQNMNPQFNWQNGSAKNQVVFKLQNMWDSILGLSRGNEKLNYKQLYFLMGFYFNNNTFEIDSKNLFSFYKSEILTLVVRNGNDISLNICPYSVKNTGDSESLAKLNSQGIFLSMLALIIEESLDILRSKVKLNIMNDYIIQFQLLFPAEILYLDLGYKGNNVLHLIQEFLLGLRDNDSKLEKLRPSLSSITCCLALLNREITNYKKSGATSSSKSGFSSIFVLLLNTFLCEEETLEIWKDPESINFSNESKRRNTDLKVHFCYLWMGVIRLSNIVTFKLVSLIKNLGEHYALVSKFYAKVASSETQQAHVNYLESLKSSEFRKLICDFQIHYMVSRIYFTLNRGIMDFCDANLSISTTENLIKECNIALKEINFNNTNTSRDIESKILLTYLSFFMSYIIFMQGEELNDDKLISEYFPKLIYRCYDFISKLDGVLRSESILLDTQYILSAITELLTRSVQIVIALLVRTNSEDFGSISQRSILQAAIDLNGTTLESVNEKQFVTQQIEEIVESVILGLNKSSLIDKDKSLRLSKLWNFYLTFIGNMSKVSAINYVKIHANVPVFKEMMTNANKCPVIDTNSTETKRIDLKAPIEGTEFKKCPIFHITTPTDVESLTGNAVSPVGRCPVDHTPMIDKPRVDNFSGSPIDHSLLKRTSSTFGANKSNVRGEFKKKKMSNLEMEPTLLHKVPTAIGNTIEQQPNLALLAQADTMSLKNEPILFDEFGLPSEFNDFDFDFDFLQNNNLLNQLNSSNVQKDQANPSIESYFQ